MDSIFGPIIFRPIGWFFNLLFDICGGHVAPAILLLTLTINVLLFPLSVRQQKSTAKQTAIKPQLERLKEKCGDDRVKYQQEMQELYQKEGVSMTGGCLTSFIRLPFLWAIWAVIRNPFTYMAGAYNPTIREAAATAVKSLGDKAGQYAELQLVNNPEALEKFGLGGIFPEGSFSLFGLDLTVCPTVKEPSIDWLFPLLAFATAMLSSVVMMRQNKRNMTADEYKQQQTMGCMMYGMPLITLFFSFSGIPAAISFYWAFSNILSMFIQMIVTKKFGPYVAISQNFAKIIKKQKEFEKTRMLRRFDSEN